MEDDKKNECETELEKDLLYYKNLLDAYKNRCSTKNDLNELIEQFLKDPDSLDILKKELVEHALKHPYDFSTIPQKLKTDKNIMQARRNGFSTLIHKFRYPEESKTDE